MPRGTCSRIGSGRSPAGLCIALGPGAVHARSAPRGRVRVRLLLGCDLLLLLLRLPDQLLALLGGELCLHEWRHERRGGQERGDGAARGGRDERAVVARPAERGEQLLDRAEAPVHRLQLLQQALRTSKARSVGKYERMCMCMCMCTARSENEHRFVQ